MLRALIACERSGVVRRAFAARGVFAVSCDQHGADDSPTRYHYTGDVRDLIDGADARHWDLLIAFPPCTYLCSSGLHWNRRRPEREALTAAALAFVRYLMAAPIAHIAIENPRGRIGSAIRRADQRIQPYEFGHDASKETHLWLTNLPRLTPTCYIAPRIVDGRPRWGNQTDSGQNRLGPSASRSYDRAKTYPGIADAMADQWTRYLQEGRP